MNDSTCPSLSGHVASLHLHPSEPDAPLSNVNLFEVIVDKGIVGNGRYFGRTSRSTGKPSRRQVTLIEREQIAEHAAALGFEFIAPGIVRSNIETFGINLVNLIGKQVAIGGAILHFYEPRTPCAKMDAIYPGLRQLMQNQHQGVLAEVIRAGIIRIGDSISPL
jgi:MOSC domain-containing protein YiiM